MSFNRETLTMGSGINMPVHQEHLRPTVDEWNGLLQLGIFGGSNNANTFFPKMNVPKDLMPKAEDFVVAPFRLLTATTVGAGTWKATDFSNASVLKASMGKLVGKPVYPDHDHELFNWLGLIQSTSWSEAKIINDKESPNPIVIPAGIDGMLMIDGKSNPKIARGVILGSIFSNSVTVEFDWKPSHTFSSPQEFNQALGTLKDGTMVRRVVTIVYDYHESSLCWLGADPFAKMYDAEGNLKNLDTTNIYSKEKPEVIQQYDADKKFSLSFCVEKNILHLTRSENKKTDIIMDKALIALRKKMKLAADAEVTEAMIEALNLEPVMSAEDTAKIAMLDKVAGLALAAAQKVDKEVKEVKMDAFLKENTFVPSATLVVLEKAQTDLGTTTTELGTVKTELTGEKTKVVDLTKERDELKPLATAGQEYIDKKRAEANRLYLIAVDNKPNAAVVELFKKAKPEELDGLLAQYTKGLTVKFGGKCKKCNSEEFEFRSTVTGDETTSNAGEVESSVTYDSIHKKYASESMDISKKRN